MTFELEYSPMETLNKDIETKGYSYYYGFASLNVHLWLPQERLRQQSFFVFDVFSNINEVLFHGAQNLKEDYQLGSRKLCTEIYDSWRRRNTSNNLWQVRRPFYIGRKYSHQ